MIDTVILRAFTLCDCFDYSNKIMTTVNLHFQIFSDVSYLPYKARKTLQEKPTVKACKRPAKLNLFNIYIS